MDCTTYQFVIRRCENLRNTFIHRNYTFLPALSPDLFVPSFVLNMANMPCDVTKNILYNFLCRKS